MVHFTWLLPPINFFLLSLAMHQSVISRQLHLKPFLNILSLTFSLCIPPPLQLNANVNKQISHRMLFWDIFGQSRMKTRMFMRMQQRTLQTLSQVAGCVGPMDNQPYHQLMYNLLLVHPSLQVNHTRYQNSREN